MAKTGRPTNYTPELGEMVCERHAAGESISKICADETMPKASTIGQWRAKFPSFAASYAQARVTCGEQKADKAEEYANATHVWVADENHEGGGLWLPIDVQRARLMADTAKWQAAKYDPRGYGDKQFVEHSGSIAVTDGTDEDLIAELFELARTGHLVVPDGHKLVELPDEDDFSDLA